MRYKILYMLTFYEKKERYIKMVFIVTRSTFLFRTPNNITIITQDLEEEKFVNLLNILIIITSL